MRHVGLSASGAAWHDGTHAASVPNEPGTDLAL